MDEVDRGHLGVAQPGQRRVAMGARPFLRRQQRRGGAIGERGGIGRGQGAAAGALVEGRLERGQLLQRGVRTQDVVALHATERCHQVGEEAALVGGGKLAVRGHRPLVLRITRHVPLPGHVLAVLAHALAGARLGHAGEFGLEFGQPEALERGDPLLHRPGAVGRQQPPAQRPAIHDRHVGGGVRTAADAGLDLAQGDLVGHGDQRIQAGAAGALQGQPRGQRRQSGRQGRLAGQVPVGRVLDHRPHRHFAQLLAMQAEAFHQRAQGPHRHAQVAHVRIGGVLAAERDADAAKDGDGADGRHGMTSGWNHSWNPDCIRSRMHNVQCSLRPVSQPMIQARIRINTSAVHPGGPRPARLRSADHG